MNRPPEKKDAKAIFSAAIEYYVPEQWEAYLVNACGDDQALRQRVRELLDAHRQSDSFFDREDGVTEGPPISERAGTQIGPYKLLQEIGEGGFGVVYMAEQVEPVRRKVALKIIKPGMDTKQVIARFEAERQALAMMDHPNIAKVLDAGATESGRPYFVMELVKGIPINEFCDTNKLPTHDRLELFVTVCHAVQHAHQKGVIHRDLKPSNVMVTLHDNKPMPVIIDFGVSKAISHQLTEKTLFTAYGQMVGTPAYMSPEQAQMSRMDIDTRSDIYSLGVLLYELLTGSTPLDAEQLRGTAYAEMQRMIREEEAPKPSTRLSTLGNALAKIAQARGTDPKKLGQFVRGDLDWIVLKALEKERNRRYETANGLANDIERFLNDEAVEATPPSLTYQMRKFVSRNRGLVTTASVVAAAILLGIIGTTIGMIRAQRDAERARVALLQADVARLRANTLAEEKQVEAQRANTLAEEKQAEAQRANTLAEEKQAEAQRALEAKQDADRLRDDAKAQVAQQLATRAGMERTRGDITLAALLDAEALSRDNIDPEREANHRRRLAADLRQSPRPRHLFFHDSPVLDARFSTDGKWIVTACEDGTVQVRDSHTGSIIQNLQHEGEVRQAVFRHDDTRLLTFERAPSSADEGTGPRQHLWDWENKQRLAVSPERILWNYSDQPWRETYPSLSPENLLQLRSTADGQPIGSPLEYTRTHHSLRSSGRQHMLLITREQVDDPPGSAIPEPPFGRQPTRWNYRAELWNGETGQSRILFEQLVSTRVGGTPPPGLMFKACYSEDRSSVAIRVRDRAIHIYDVDTGQQIQQLVDAPMVGNRSSIQSIAGVIPVEFGPNNKLLMCKTPSEIVLFDIASGEVVGRRIPVKAPPPNCGFSPDGSRILSINQQGNPQTWYTSTSEAASPPLEHAAEVREVAFSGDGRFVKVVCVDGTVRVWDSLSGVPAAPLLKHIGAITTSSFSRDGSHLLVAAGENVWIWPIGWPEFSQLTIPVSSGAGVRQGRISAGISSDGQRIVTGGVVPKEPSSTNWRAEFRVWESTTAQQALRPIVVDLQSGTWSPFAGGGVVATRFSSDGRRILITYGSSSFGRRFLRPGGILGESAAMRLVPVGWCRVWNLDSGKVVTLEPSEDLSFRQARFSTDGRCVKTVFEKRGSRGGPVGTQTQLWDSETGKSLGPPLDVATSRFYWSPDGHLCATIEHESSGQHVLVRDMTTGKRVGPALEHQAAVSQLEFCDAGRCLVTLVRHEDRTDVSLWDTATCLRKAGPLSFPTEGSSPQFIISSVSPASECVAIHTFSSNPARTSTRPLSPTVTIHHFDSGSRLSLQHERGVTDAVFDPEGRYLMTTSVDNVVRIWDPLRGELVRTLRPESNEGPPVSAQFSDDGQRIVTTAAGNVFRVWEVATGQPLSAMLQGPFFSGSRLNAQQGLWSSAADRFLLQGDGQTIIHDLSPEKRPVNELLRMTRVLSGRRVNPLGNVETLSPDQLEQEWYASIDHLRDRLLEAPSGLDWHRLQAQKTDDHSAQLWHLDRLLEADPRDDELLLRRGRLLAKLNRHDEALADFDAALANDATGVRLHRANSLAHLQRWDEAASDLETIIPEMESQQVPVTISRIIGQFRNPRAAVQEALGLAHLLAGNRDDYEQVCQDMISGEIPGPIIFLRLTLLVPRSGEYCDGIAERLDENSSARRFSELITARLGIGLDFDALEALIALRRGDAEGVVDSLAGYSRQRTAAELLVTAMARSQLGDSDQARRLLDAASDKMRSEEGRIELLPKGETAAAASLSAMSRARENIFAGQTWTDAAVAEILHREAEQLILSAPATNESTTADEKRPAEDH